MHRKPPYDVVRDFESVMLMANQGSMIALHPSVPVRNVRELKDVLRLPDIVQRTRQEELEIVANSPEELGSLLAAEVRKCTRIVKERSMQLD